MHQSTTLVILSIALLSLPACGAAPEGGEQARDAAPVTSTAAPPDSPRVVRADTLIVGPDSTQRSEGPLYPFGVSPDGYVTAWGFRTADGRVVITPRYEYVRGFHEGLAAVQVKTEANEGPEYFWGYIDPDGEWVIPPRLTGAGDFSAGRALVDIGGELVFINRTGAVVGKLLDPQRLAGEGDTVRPEPCSGCGLEEYAESLGAVGPTLYVVVTNDGERRHVYWVTHRPHGVITIREGGWEWWSYTLRIPGITLEQGVALARRIGGLEQAVPKEDSEASGVVVFKGDTSNDEFRIRVSNGVVEIVYLMSV
jgi:hypothetical protein